MNTIFRRATGLTCVLAAISVAMLTFSPVQATRIARVSGSVVNAEIPFKALMSGSAAFTSPTTVEFDNTGHATHLGGFVASGIAVLDASTGVCPGGPNVPNVHTETLTAANGDELVIRMVNVACPTGPYTYRGTGQWTVLSGTGRFQNVTGQGTNEGHVDFESNTFEMALTGTLSRE